MKQTSIVNKGFISLAVFFSVFFLSAAGFAQTSADNVKEGDLPKRLATPAEVSKLSEWQRYNFSAAGFSILFPNMPGQHKFPNPLSREYANHYFYFWDTSDEQLFLGTVILELAPNISDSLENNVENFRRIQKKKNSTPLSEKKIEINGVPAVDFYYQIPDEPTPVLSYTRLIHCGKRVFTLIGSGTKYQKDLAEVVSKFFSSFSPTEKCEAPAVKNAANSEDETIENSVKTPRRKAGSTKSASTGTEPTSRRYIRGPKGGCYYINGAGNKVYVSRSLCG